MLPAQVPSPSKARTFFPWVLVLLLAATVATMIALWRPWQKTIPANSRTVEVTGTATVKAEPDEYVFNPSYQFKGTNKNALIEDLTNKSTEIVTQLKKLGVPDSKIKTNASGYSSSYYFDSSDNTSNYNLSVTVTLNSKELSQKVQDYLVTTNPEGSVTPYATFSTTKQKELQAKARDEATANARSKADQSAKNLGFKVGQVKSVADGDLATAMPYAAASGTQDLDVKEGSSSSPSLAVQPGENELNYSVKVVYFIK